MDQQPPDLTPFWTMIGGGAVLAGLGWFAKHVWLTALARTEIKKMSAEQKEFHARVVADVDRIDAAVGLIREGMVALSGHQEAAGVRVAGLDQQVQNLVKSMRESR